VLVAARSVYGSSVHNAPPGVYRQPTVIAILT
jgi:hypothetical protein